MDCRGLQPYFWNSVAVTVRNVATGAAVANATVSGSFSPGGTASCLTGKAVTYDVTSDGPATLTLSDGRVLRLVNGSNSGVLR